MRKLPTFLGVFLAAAVLSGAGSTAARSPNVYPPMCRAEDFTSQLSAHTIRSFLSTARPGLLAAAESLGLAGMPTAPLTLVTDEAICVRGEAEMDSLGTASTSNAVYVFQIATSHWVVDPATLPTGIEVGRGFVFDSLWAYKGTLTLWGTGG